MEIRNGLTLLDSFLALNGQGIRPEQLAASTSANKTLPKKPLGSIERQDVVSLSGRQLDEQNPNNSNFNQRTALVSERTEELDNGFRRLQEFENAEGRPFTRIEEVINDGDRSRRTVVQQFENGSTTLLENIIDRQEDGSFRVTQRFIDETGEAQTNIRYNETPNNIDFILGRTPQPQAENDNPFQTLRGIQIDVSA